MSYVQNQTVNILNLCCAFLLLASVVLSRGEADIRCGPDHTLKSESFILYEQEGADVFINVWSPDGFHNSTLPVWTVNSNESDLTSEEVRRLMIIHYGGLTLYHVDLRLHNTMYQYNISSVGRRETYTSGWLTLKIGYAPRVSDNDDDDDDVMVIAVDGRMTPLTCFGITSSPMSTYSLFKIINNSSRISVHPVKYHFSTGCLQMGVVSLHDSGHYQVGSANCFGIALVNFSLSVTVRHPSVMLGFPVNGTRSITVTISENLVVPYQVTGSPTLTISWFHEGTHLVDNCRISHNWTHLLLGEVMTHDAGLYTVIVENSGGSDSDQFSLIVQNDSISTSGNSDIFWGVTAAIALVSSLIGGLLSGIFIWRRLKLKWQTNKTWNTQNNTSGYCEMHIGSTTHNGSIRPYSTTQIVKGTEVAGYWVPDLLCINPGDTSRENDAAITGSASMTSDSTASETSGPYECMRRGSNQGLQLVGDMSRENGNSGEACNHSYINVPGSHVKTPVSSSLG